MKEYLMPDTVENIFKKQLDREFKSLTRLISNCKDVEEEDILNKQLIDVNNRLDIYRDYIQLIDLPINNDLELDKLQRMEDVISNYKSVNYRAPWMPLINKNHLNT